LREEPLPNIDFSKAYAGGLSMKRYPTLVYTVREVVQVDEEEVLVRIDLPHLERVTPGQSGEFIIANRGQKDWSPKAIGRAEVTEAGRDPLVSIRLESRRGQPLEVQVGDIVKLETTPEDPAMGSSFFSLARHRIGFTSHNTKHGSYYDIETVRVADDTIQHYFTYEVMAHDIRAAAAELRSSSEKLPGEYSAKAHRPKYREEHRVIDIMEWAGIKDLSSFFYYVELEKDWLMGKDWPLHELFARWVRTGKIR
jgi:hypothetical protein